MLISPGFMMFEIRWDGAAFFIRVVLFLVFAIGWNKTIANVGFEHVVVPYRILLLYQIPAFPHHCYQQLVNKV